MLLIKTKSQAINICIIFFSIKLVSKVDSPYVEVDYCKVRVDPTESKLCRVNLAVLIFFEESILAVEKLTPQAHWSFF